MFTNHKPVQISYLIYVYMITTVLMGGHTQNVSYMFQSVLEGGLEHVSLHFECILTTLPTKTTPRGRSATNFTFKGQNMYLTFWYGPPLNSTLQGVVIIHSSCSNMFKDLQTWKKKITNHALKTQLRHAFRQDAAATPPRKVRSREPRSETCNWTWRPDSGRSPDSGSTWWFSGNF